jgi:hypothetical protein
MATKEKSVEDQIRPHFEALEAISAKYNIPLIVAAGVGNREILTTIHIKKENGIKLQAAAAILSDEPERALTVLLTALALERVKDSNVQE